MWKIQNLQDLDYNILFTYIYIQLVWRALNVKFHGFK